ncbi:filamentous hemagglutinin N-terminal domain-containing protein, partial [Pseudomonas sp.]|uniref:two-partner secretion domain-containing protein n=1 Tax=Pseudomonas sp. TaxID=306 RepID=UPI003C7791E2
AQADGIVVSAPGTTLGQAGNGVPIVNIAAPNGSGLSHNQFKDYNVGQQGVILNNATSRTQSTQLGGIILGNSNLKGNAANVILNEVNGGSPSQLRGYTEVAGQSAHVIVANPYGITCNGCGFINTPQATLTTGKAVIENGQVNRYQVDGGSVAIEGAGLNANNIDRFEIITRSAKLNAEIQAKNLTIIAGANDVDAKTLNATARTADPATKPQLAIDSSALGGMYAGAIKLVSSEAGVGVKLDGKMAASAGDIQIAANGDLTVAQIAANGAVNVKATRADLQGTVYGSNVNVQARDALTIQQNIAARDQIKLGTQGQLANNAIIEAGVNDDNTRNTTGDIKIRAQGMRNNGSVVASRDVRVSVDQALDNSGGIVSAQRVAKITAGTLDNRNGGKVLSADTARINADNLLNTQGKIYSQGDLRIVSADLDNRGGEIASKAGIRLIGGSLNNSDSGSLISEQTLNIQADQMLNQLGLISGLQGLEVKGGKLDNSNHGKLSSLNGEVRVELSGDLANSNAGALVSQKALAVSAANIDNRQGSLSSGAGQTLTVNGVLDNSNKGQIDSAEALVVTAMTLRNVSGTISSQLGLTVTGTDLDNTDGSIATNGAATLDLLGTLTNTNGTFASVGDLLLKRADQVNNQRGQLASQRMMTLLTGGLDNRNGGTVAVNGQLLLTASGVVQNDNDGLIYSKSANLNLQAASLENAKGTLQSQTALELKTSGDVDNLDGNIIAQDGELSVTADHVDNRGGTLSSLQNAFTARITGVLKNGYDLDGKGGTIQAQSLDIRALAGISNYGGRIAAQGGDALIDTRTADFDNRRGGLYAKQGVIVTGNHFDNSGDKGGQISGQIIDLTLDGDLNNRLGIIESDSTLTITAASIDNQTGKLRALGNSGITRFQIGGRLNNQSGMLETANNDINLTTGSLLNTGGSIMHAGKGNFGVASSDVMNAGGSFTTGGDLTLDAESWTNSGVIQAGTLNVNIKNFTQTATGQLLASTAFLGTSDIWVNNGVLGSDGTLGLKLTGGYSGSGRMSSLAELKVAASQLDLGATASITGGGKTDINVIGQLNNYGRLTSGSDMTVTATGLANYGALAASQDLVINAETLLNDQAEDGSRGFIFSGRNMSFQANSIKNRYADIYSIGNLIVTGRAPGSSAQRLENRSGSIEAGGDINVDAANFANQRDKFSMEQVVVGGFMTMSCVQHCDGPQSPRVRGPVFIYKTVESTVSVDSPMATFVSGHNLTVNSTSVLNQYSLLSAANDLSITSTNIINQAALSASGTSGHEVGAGNWVSGSDFYRLMSDVRTYNNQHPSSGPFDPVAFGQLVAKFDPSLFYGINDPVTVQADGKAAAPAIIQAGGASKVSASNDISNLVVQKTTTAVEERSANTSVFSVTQPSTVLLNRQLPPDLAKLQVDPTTLPGFSLPTGQNGLFRLNAQDTSGAAVSQIVGVQGLPNSVTAVKPPKYLIETNPALTDLKQFMSSDYLLTRLGYDPDTSAKRLGDGLYEQRLVQQAVVARTGQAFIDGQTSNEDQFKYLMNNAIASKNELNLAVGVSLTSQQVAALTHDIVWLEEHEVNGEKVLVPVLYMAQANNRLAPNGALIQGTDLTMIAGKNLTNAGTLKATDNLSAVAGQDMVSSGLVQAGGRLDLLASKDLTNKAGGVIAGKDVALTALTGDVTNERTVTSSQIAYGKDQVRNDYVDSAARVESANDLNISAGRDINNIGGALQSGLDVILGASRDVNIASAQATNSLDRGVNRNSSSTTQYSASISAGRDVSVQAGRDVTVFAGDIDAERDIGLVGAGDVTISSAADESHFLSKNKRLTIQEDHVRQVASNITAGGNIAVSAGNDMAITSSRITAGKEAYLAAGNKLGVYAAQDSDYSLYDEKSKGSFGAKKTKRDEVTQVTNISSQITSGGDMVLASGGDQLYQAAKLTSGEDLLIKSGGSVTFEAVKDLHQENHAKSNTSFVWNTTKGQGKTDETLRQTQILTKGNLTIQAVDGLKIDIKQIDQHTVSQAIDAMVKADPQLAWLKEAERRGDVDWRKVQEVHESFKYNNSSLGGGAALVIAIIVTYFTWGAGAGLVGAASTSTTGLAASAVYTGVAIKAATSTINNKGNLGDIAKDVTSGESLKGYAIAGLSGPIAKLFGVTGAFTAADLGRQLAVNSALKTVINGGSFGKNVGQAAIDLTASLLSGMIYERVGSALVGSDLSTKVAVHAIVGGLIAEAAGGDFASAAIAAGANKALIQTFGEDLFPGEAHERVLAMTSQLIGMTVAAGLGGNAKDQEVAGWVAQQGTIYNELQHKEVEALIGEARTCEAKNNCRDVINKYADLNEANEKRLNGICESDPAKCREAYSEWVMSYYKTHELISQARASGSLPDEVSRMLIAVDYMNTQSRDRVLAAGIAQNVFGAASNAAAGVGVDVAPETLGTLSKWTAILFGVGKAGTKATGAAGESAGAMRRLDYEAAPYHGKVDNAVKSRAPVNGQEALDFSIQVKPTSPRRVGIDYDSKDFVVFDKTLDTTYHGHVRSWSDLHPDMQKALQQAGMADRKGNILTGGKR